MTHGTLLARQERRKTLPAQVPLGIVFLTLKQIRNIPPRHLVLIPACQMKRFSVVSYLQHQNAFFELTGKGDLIKAQTNFHLSICPIVYRTMTSPTELACPVDAHVFLDALDKQLSGSA